MSLVKKDLKKIHVFYICEVSYSKEKERKKKYIKNLTAVGK